MDIPEIRFVETDDGVRVAYQLFGSGPSTVYAPVGMSSIEGLWGAALSRTWERMAANLRVVLFDHRGSGLSDGFDTLPSLAERALDVKAVMGASGMDSASLWGFEFGAQVAMAFAAEYPSRVDRIVLVNGRVGQPARQMADKLAPEAPDRPADVVDFWEDLAGLENVGVELNRDVLLRLNPSLSKHPDFFAQMLSYERSAGSRSAQKRHAASIFETNSVEIAPIVEAPTLIVHAEGNRMHHVGYARYLAQLIPNATLVELPGEDQMYWLSDNWKDYVDAGIAFIAEAPVEVPVERKLAVVMFTDIVGSTETAVGTGDSEWRTQLDMHDRLSDRIVTHHRGTVVKNTGDGILATFDMASQALAAAHDLRSELSKANIEIRTGIHAGEIEVRGTDVAGAAVHLAARVQQAASGGTIYTTTAIYEMLIGSPYEFADAGTHHLKGFKEQWRLYRATTP